MAQSAGSDVEAYCRQLLAINRSLFNSGLPEAAYHALQAVLYCAEDQGDIDILHRAASVAANEHGWIAEHVRAAYGNSAASLAEHQRWMHLEGLYAVAERQARIKALNLNPKAR